ncbi:MAG: hypothetical protein VX223_03620 [Myxococcota bacterium]|nr:hypothetical protein [Myxococcota bacterium]
MKKPLEVVCIEPPPKNQRVCRNAAAAEEGEKRTRYTLPKSLKSNSVVGYRSRIPLSKSDAAELMPLLALERPSTFVPGEPPTEQAIFEESALGILSSRQSTNYRGFKQITLGPDDSQRAAELLRGMQGLEAKVLDGACHTHIVLSRPYRTPFTLLLTFVGHKAFKSLVTVPVRALKKRTQFIDDIPTIGYLQHLHIGILADGMERAASLASQGRRAANIFMAPFTKSMRASQKKQIAALEKLCGLTWKDRAKGWNIAIMAQVGHVPAEERLSLSKESARKAGANLLAFRSERIQPGVNQEERAPAGYQSRQDMRFPQKLIDMAGRAGFNAFGHWMGVDRERVKELMLLDRIDVLTDGGKERLRGIRRELGMITDWLIRDLPLWADLSSGRQFSKNANRGRKAFALVGQRIYVGGLDKEAVKRHKLDWELAVQAMGAAAARSSLYCELMGVVDLPDDCDLLAGICLMAGPVNQNDIGKQFYGVPDLLKHQSPDGDPTSLLVWTFKAKTIADPLGNEEQLLNKNRKGALVDLRPGPHEVIQIRKNGRLVPLRGGKSPSMERAFADQGNFVTARDGSDIPGNPGESWPGPSNQPIW